MIILYIKFLLMIKILIWLNRWLPTVPVLLGVTIKLILYYVKENDQEITILFLHSFLQFSFCLSFTAVCFHASLQLTPLELGVGLLQLEVTSKEGRLWLPRIVKPIRLFINALVSVRRRITGNFFSQRFRSQIMTRNNQS